MSDKPLPSVPSPLPVPERPGYPPAEQARLSGILAALPDAVLCVDRNWHITYANDEAIRISRLHPEEFAERDFWEIHPTLLGLDLERQYRDAMASGKAGHVEFYYPPFEVWVDIHILPTDEGFALVYRDITEPKQAEAREAAAARQIRQVFEATADGIVIIDRNWRFTFANQRALELVGSTDIIGHDIFELFPGNLEEPFQSTYRGTMATRMPNEFEAFHGHPLNLWVHVLAKPYEDGIIVFFSDITARKNAELREQATANRLAQVLEVTSDAVVLLDREWRYTFLNTNAKKLIDPEDRLLGRNLWEEFPLAATSPAWEAYHRSMDEGLPGYAELFYPAPLNAWLAATSQPTPEGIVVFFRDITQQRQHDEIVRGQLDLLTEVQTASRLATWECDLDSGKITYGPGAYEVFGHPLESVSSVEQMEQILLPAYVEAMRAETARCVETGQPLLIEFGVTAADGSTVWIESRGQATHGTGGSACLRGMSIDVTKRRIDQQELIASEARYRVLADLNPHAIWMGDPEGNITYANQGFLSYIGLKLEELGGEGWLNAFAPSDRARVRAVWTRSVQTGEDYDIEALIRRADTGEHFYWHLRATAVRDANDAVLHWLGVGQDIHDIKTYTAALRFEQMETEQRRAELETIYKTTPIGLALLDPVEFKFLNLNDHEASMLGYPKEEIVGRPLAEIAPIPHLLDLFRTVAKGSEIRDYLLEGELSSRPGETRFWSVNYSPIYNENGSIRAISTASIEITNQKKAEAALIQSEKLAAVGRLASSISHEINNPLEAITNLLYLIGLDNSLPQQLRSYVQLAQSELNRVSQIATQTLRFHRQAVAPTMATPGELVDAVIRLYTGRLTNSSISVDAHYRTSTRILCFENDIRQVLNNLIANAIDAMRKGGRLIARAHDTSYPRPGVRILIADTGHGMTPEVLTRIFEPFYTTKDLNGTGLGLWISSGIIDRHQGRMLVRSSVDPRHHGTVFSLFLPCREDEAAAATTEA